MSDLNLSLTPETPENHYDSVDESSVIVGGEPALFSNVAHQTTTAIDANDTVASSEALAKGISSMLATVIRDFDSRADDAVKSQDQLCFAIDRLTKELDQLLDDAPLPFIMQHAAKISSVRKRVSSLNSLLKSIQRRLDNVDRILFVGLPHDMIYMKGASNPTVSFRKYAQEVGSRRGHLMHLALEKTTRESTEQH